MHKVIMAPTEGSEKEMAAISVAVKLAQRFDADLHLVRAEAPPLVIETVGSPPVLAITEQTLLAERLARLRKLEALGNEYRAVGKVRVMTALMDGPITSTLADYATQHQVDLTVMSSHSRGGLKRITLGSVTDYLIRNTSIPVLVVRPPTSLIGATPEQALSRIVVPLDGSELAEQVLPEVAALASRFGSTISLLHVLTPETYSQKQIMQPALPWWDADMALANSYLDEAASDLTGQGLTVSKDVVLSDDITSAILDYAARTKADLVALATRGKGGVSRLVFGSVADEITRRSATSLLVFHPKRCAAVEDPAARSEGQTLAGA
ncbi:MAG TPA: universal stress protein [Gemmatimonadaceae bacterium]|jgi:nucleotide-binding universal stress UspA family protein